MMNKKRIFAIVVALLITLLVSIGSSVLLTGQTKYEIVNLKNNWTISIDGTAYEDADITKVYALSSRELTRGDELVMTTTLQHEFVAELISPFVRDGQIIILVPGYMGSLIFKKYIKKNIIYSEWETTAYNGRIVNNEYVRISFYNPRNAISVLPISQTQKMLDILSPCFDNTKYNRKHILESAFHNPNMIVHPIGILFSASRIEYSNGEFWMYREAFTPSVVNVIKAFDVEKNKVLQTFGCDPLDYFEAAKWRNEENLNIDAMTVFRSFADSSNKGPSFINHRYLLEDVPMGLGLFISVAKIVGVDTSIQEGITALASALLNKDLKSDARTIQYLLGKEDVSIDDIKKAITE